MELDEATGTEAKLVHRKLNVSYDIVIFLCLSQGCELEKTCRFAEREKIIFLNSNLNETVRVR